MVNQPPIPREPHAVPPFQLGSRGSENIDSSSLVDKTVGKAAKDKIGSRASPLKTEQLKEKEFKVLDSTDEEDTESGLGSSLGEDSTHSSTSDLTADDEAPPALEEAEGFVEEGAPLVLPKGPGKKPALLEKFKPSVDAVKTNQISANVIARGAGTVAGSLWSGTKFLLGTTAKYTGLTYVGTSAAKAVAGKVVKRYSMDVKKEVAQSKEQMLQNLKDPQFVEFYDMVWVLLSSIIGGQLTENLPADMESAPILDLAEINIARGFVNLARQVSEQKGDIPNYDEQPSLVSVLSLLCEKAGHHIDAARLQKIEEDYRDVRVEFATLKHKLLPNISPVEQDQIEKYIKNADDNPDLIIYLKKELFPDLDEDDEAMIKEVDAFLETCIYMRQRHQEFNQLFGEVIEVVLTFLFPNKLNDLQVPGVLQYGFVQSRIYNGLKSALTDLLQKSYEPMENDAVKLGAWERTLKMTVGAPDLKPVIAAPAALIKGVVDGFIKSDPRAVGFTAAGLASLFHPQEEGRIQEEAELSETEKKEQTLNQLSQESLANWIVDSVHAILNTEDPNLGGLGSFAKQVLNNLTLALLAKGAKLVIPEGEKVKNNQFIKALSNGIVEKVAALKGNEVIPDEFWKEFIADLPLPPLVKDALLPKLIEKAKNLQTDLKEKAPELEAIQNLYAESEEKVKGYKSGAELFSIAEKISDQVIEQLLEKNIGLIAELGLGDNLDELFAQYMPGVKINDELKNWFKQNISSLGAAGAGESPQSVILLKQAVKAVILKALSDTIETNFKGDSEDYAAQLLSNIRQAFATAVGGFDAAERVKLVAALSIQDEINGKEQEIARLRKIMAEKPAAISQEELTILEEALDVHMRLVRTEDHASNLDIILDKLLAELNAKQPGKNWDINKLRSIGPLLAFYKARVSNDRDLNALTEALKAEAVNIQGLVNVGVHDIEEGTIEIRKRKELVALLEMPAEELQLLCDAANADVTIQRAEKELKKIQVELEIKKGQVLAFKPLENSESWNKAVEWVSATMDARDQIHELSQEVATLQEQLDTKLTIFQTLSHELLALLGLGQKENLRLPAFLVDQVWPLIEAAEKKQIARLSFREMSPVLLTITDIEKNKARLIELAKGDQFLNQLVETASTEAIKRIPDYLSSFRPFAEQLLTKAGCEHTKDIIDVVDAELTLLMIELGKKGTAGSMLQPLLKGIVSEENEEAIGARLAQLIQGLKESEEVTKNHMLSFLKKELPAAEKKEEQLEQQAQQLAKNINQFLLTRGKGKLSENDLLKLTQDLAENPIDLKETDFKEMLEKIKRVVITPEEIAEILNSIIPGATDLQTLIAPQLQAVISGQDEAFSKNREFLQSYIEGVLLKLFVRIAEANTIEGQGILAVLTGKLEAMIASGDELEGKTSEEVEVAARRMIDKILNEVINLKSEKDFQGIPPIFRDIAFSKMKEAAYLKLTPVVMTMIEREQNRQELEKRSGSKFLGSLSAAISKDLFRELASGVEKSHEEIVAAISGALPDLDPALCESFAAEIDTVIKSEGYQHLSGFLGAYVEGALLKIFLLVAEKNPAEGKGKDKKDTLIVLTEKLLNKAAASYKDLAQKPEATAGELDKWIMEELLGIKSSEAFHFLPDPVKGIAYAAIQNQLGGFLIRIQKGLASLEGTNESVKQVRETSKKFGVDEVTGKAFAQIIAEDLSTLVIDSVPAVLTEKAGEEMKGVVTISKSVESLLEELKRGNMEVAKLLLDYTKGGQFQQMLGDRLGAIADPAKFVEDKKKAAELVSHLVLVPLTNVLEKAVDFENAHKEQATQKVMASILQVVADNLENMNQATKLAKERAAKLGGRAEVLHQDFVEAAGKKLHAAVPTEQVTYQKTIDLIGSRIYGRLKPDQRPLWLAEQANLRAAIARLVKEENQGIGILTMDKIIAEIDKINVKITGSPLSKEKKKALKAVDENGLTLRNVIRQEAQAPEKQRLENAYTPAIKTVMDMLFPNGKEDLKSLSEELFASEALRDQTWKLLETNLFPMIMQMITELLLSPDTINTIILNSLQAASGSLSGPIVPGPEVPQKAEMDDLDRASGALVEQVVNVLQLPDWIRSKITDKEGKLNDSMKKSIGGALRNQFNETFIQKNLKFALEKMSERKKGEPVLKFDAAPKTEKLAQTEAARLKMQKDLKSEFRKVVGVSIRYFIRSMWASAQARFDLLVNQAFGKIGSHLKAALDTVFRFIFFTIIGTILSWLLFPAKLVVREFIYWTISLDANREKLLSLLTRAPTDQPITEGHVVYLENMVYQMVEAAKEAVVEVLDEVKVPLSNEKLTEELTEKVKAPEA